MQRLEDTDVGDLIAFPMASLRPRDGLFYETVETVMNEAISRLRKELGPEVRIVGIVSSPAPPSDGNAAEYNIDFCAGGDDDSAKEDAAGILASIAVHLSDSLEEMRETVQGIANRAQKHAKSLYESEREG